MRKYLEICERFINVSHLIFLKIISFSKDLNLIQLGLHMIWRYLAL